jgi:Zn-dependent protease with chaperone function
MFLVFSLAVICALGLSNACAPEPVPNSGRQMIVVLLGTLTTPTLALAISRAMARAVRREPGQSLGRLIDRCTILQRLHGGLWLLMTCLILFHWKWPTIVRVNWQLAAIPLLDDLLILAPVCLPWLLSWLAFDNIEHRLTASVDVATQRHGRWQYTISQARLYLGISILPVLAVVFVADVTRSYLPEFAGGDLAWLPLLAPLAVMFVFFPLLLRWIWDTNSLRASPLRARLLGLAADAGQQVRDILVWRTEDQTENAAVAGILPSLQYVFLTDSLVNRFSETEVEATFAHELGHLRHHHNAKRMLALLVPVSVIGCGHWLTARLAIGDVSLALHPLACLTLLILYMVFSFGWYSRQLEFQADVHACELLSRLTEPPVAKHRFQSVLGKLEIGARRRRRTWLHPSADQRQQLLDSIWDNPHCRRRFDRRLRTATWLCLSALIGPPILCLVVAVT